MKSDIFKLSVAQELTLAVKDGQNVPQNLPSSGIPGPNWEGFESSGAKPPAALIAHIVSAALINTRAGAAILSTSRIDFMPFNNIRTCMHLYFP